MQYYYKRTQPGTGLSTVGSYWTHKREYFDQLLAMWNATSGPNWTYEEITEDEFEARKNEPYPWEVDIVDWTPGEAGGRLVFVPKTD